MEDLLAETSPERFVGRSPEQVDEFLAEEVQQLLDASAESLPRDEVRV
jgi:hypothetical protein